MGGGSKGSHREISEVNHLGHALEAQHLVWGDGWTLDLAVPPGSSS